MAEDPARGSVPAATVTLSPLAPPDDTRRPVWGPWASIGWTTLAAFTLLATQVMALVVYAVVRLVVNPKFNPEALALDGKLVAVATILGALPVLGLIVLLCRVRGWRVGDYLALHPASGRATTVAIAGLILGLAASDGLTIVLGRPIVPPLMAETITTAPLWLISLAVAVAAPITEEVVFRGFLYRGLAASPRLGPGMAIGMTALAWAGLHAAQYDLYGLATIYLTGLYLGLIRYGTGSTFLTIILHALANTIATAEAVYFSG